MTRSGVTVQIERAGFVEHAMQLDEARRHHCEVRHHRRVFQEAVERFYHFDDSDVRAVVDELMIRLGSVGPAPGVGKGVKLRLAHFAARLAKENIVIRVRVKRRIEINKIDTRIRELFRVPQPREFVAKIQTVHRGKV